MGLAETVGDLARHRFSAIKGIDHCICPGTVQRHALLRELVDAVARGDGSALMGQLVDILLSMTMRLF